MNTSTPTNTNIIRRGFTLIEILIVVVILGILAAVVVPQFTNASEDANDAAVRSQLQTLRGQIELYRAQQGSDPNLLTSGWTDLKEGNYLMVDPKNPLTASATAGSIAAAAADGVAWIWKDKSATNTTKGLFAGDDSETSYLFDE
jgi:prepilin-type N-terminal cleavage/methylation domain-containing protein